MSSLKNSLTAVLVATLLQSSPGQLNQKNYPVLDVTVVELQENGAVYDNKRVRVRGEYPLWDGIGLKDPTTGKILASIRLEFKDDPDVAKECRPFEITEFFKLVQSGELQRAIKEEIPWIVPIPVQPVPTNQLKAVRKLWKQKDSKTAEIVVVGRFDYIKWGGRLVLHQDGTPSWTGGFGPGPGQSPERIVVETIVIQKKAK